MKPVSRKLLRLRAGLRLVQSSRFVRNVAAVATGVAASQVISLAFLPFLTRIFGPEAFGALAVFNSIVKILTPLATLGFVNAIVMADSEKEATAVARLSLTCAAVATTLFAVIVLCFNPKLAELMDLEHSPEVLYLIPVALSLMAFLSVTDQAAIREGLFGAKAKSKVASTLVMSLGKLAAGLVLPVAWVLILLENIGKAVNTLMLLALVPRRGAFRVSEWFGVQGIGRAARNHLDFALFRMPQSIINAAAVGLPVILLTAYFGSEYAGQYSLTTLVLGAPMLLLGQSVGEVFYPKITSAIRHHSPDAWRQMVLATIVLGGLSFIPFGVVVLFGPELFTLVLGDEWTRAGEYAQWVSVWLGMSLAARPVVASFPALRLQSYLLFQEVLSVALRTGAFFVGILYWKSDMAAVALFSIVGFFLMGMHIFMGFWKLRKEMQSWDMGPASTLVENEVSHS